MSDHKVLSEEQAEIQSSVVGDLDRDEQALSAALTRLADSLTPRGAFLDLLREEMAQPLQEAEQSISDRRAAPIPVKSGQSGQFYLRFVPLGLALIGISLFLMMLINPGPLRNYGGAASATASLTANSEIAAPSLTPSPTISDLNAFYQPVLPSGGSIWLEPPALPAPTPRSAVHVGASFRP